MSVGLTSAFPYSSWEREGDETLFPLFLRESIHFFPLDMVIHFALPSILFYPSKYNNNNKLQKELLAWCGNNVPVVPKKHTTQITTQTPSEPLPTSLAAWRRPRRKGIHCSRGAGSRAAAAAGIAGRDGSLRTPKPGPALARRELLAGPHGSAVPGTCLPCQKQG